MRHPSNVAPTTTPPKSRVKVVGAPQGYGLVATEPIAEGEALWPVEGVTTDRASRYSIQVDDGTHIDVVPGMSEEERRVRYPWRFINHSCAPNTVLRGRWFVALKSIGVNESVTYDYNTTEFDLADPFECQCGESRCIGSISGFKHLSLDEQERLRPWLADHLRRVLAAVSRAGPV